MTILYAKAGETKGWRWLHVIDLDKNSEVRGAVECDVVKGTCVVMDRDRDSHEIKGRFKIVDERQ